MKACSLTATDKDGDGNANFTDFLTFAGKFGSRLGQERYDPRGDAMAMVKLTLPIVSSPPPTLARQAERRKMQTNKSPGSQ